MKLQETLDILKDELKPALTKHCFNISIYGSAAREIDFNSNWSDVDVLVVPNYNFLCPRIFHNELAKSYTNVRERIEKKGAMWGIENEVNFSVYDMGSIKSGTYAWMLPNFKEHLKKSAKVIYGDDFRDILSDKFPEANEESGVAYAVWRTRSAASTLNYNRKHDKRQFMYDFKKSIKALGNFFRSAVILKGEKLRSDTKYGIAEQFSEEFPEVNGESISEVLGVPLLWPDKINQDEMVELFYNGLKIRETAVKVLASSK